MDWNSMKIFLAIAETENLVDASKKLALSHSTVFRRLNDFEEQIEGRLFDRRDGHYELTELGEEFLTLASPILSSVEGIERHLIGRDKRPSGVVKITVPTSFAYNYFPKIIKGFNKVYPEIQIELLVSDQEVNMSNRHADIAIRVSSTPPETLVGRMVKEISWGIYASKSYIKQKGHLKKAEELSGHSIIGGSNNLKRLAAFQFLDKNYSENIVCRSDDLVTMSHLAGEGIGLAILPRDLKNNKINHICDFNENKPNKLWVLTHPDLRKVERIKIVMKFLSESLKSIDI
jgi:DNA-binding transcriptional LysR family regulator